MKSFWVNVVHRASSMMLVSIAVRAENDVAAAIKAMSTGFDVYAIGWREGNRTEEIQITVTERDGHTYNAVSEFKAALILYADRDSISPRQLTCAKCGSHVSVSTVVK